MPRPVYLHPLQVVPDDIDQQGHVNNVTFVRYVQETATAHWMAAAPDEVRTTVGWVVRRHEIEYLKPAFLGDELLARTWVGEPSAATWERFTEITRVADGGLLVKARTVWVLVDATSGRPRRIDLRWAAPLMDEG